MITDNEILNLVEILLTEEEDFMVPLQKLHELILQEKEGNDLEIGHLTGLLEQDKRFKLLESKSTLEPWSDEYDEKMEQLGFYKGPRVILLSRMPDKEELYQTMVEKMQSTIDALKNVYSTKPTEMNDEEEMEFLQIMNKVKNLQNKLQDEKIDDADDPS